MSRACSLGILALLLTAVASTGCAAEGVSDTEAQGDAISADEAADNLGGGGSAKKYLEGFAATTEANGVGVHAWTAFGLNKRDFQGVVLFGLDRDGDVKLALFAAKKAEANAGNVALVNYDKRGPIAPTANDARTLQALERDMTALREAVSARALEDGKSDCAASAAATGLAMISGAILVGGMFAVAITTTPVWVVAGVVGAGVASLAGSVKGITLIDDVTMFREVFDGSCKAKPTSTIPAQ